MVHIQEEIQTTERESLGSVEHAISDLYDWSLGNFIASIFLVVIAFAVTLFNIMQHTGSVRKVSTRTYVMTQVVLPLLAIGMVITASYLQEKSAHDLVE